MADILAASVCRNFCIRFVETLECLMAQAEKDPSKLHEARTRYEMLPDHINDFKTNHVQIMTHSSNADKQEELFIEYDDFFTSVCKIKTQFKNPPFCEPSNADISNITFSSQASSQSHTFARLPKLDLPHFSGDIANWNSFYDLFNSSIHENDSLRPAQKFQYLKSVLEKEPLSLIKNLSLSDDNYPVAIKLLKDRYAQKRLISSLHIQMLLELQKPIPMTYNNATKFAAAINEHTEALRANHEPIDDWSPLLASIMITKFDTQTRNNFERTLSKDKLPTLTELKDFLNTFIQSQQWQSVQQTHSSVNESRPKQGYSKPNSSVNESRPKQGYSKSKQHKTSTFLATTNPVSCIACTKSHALFKCHTFQSMEPSKRLNLVRTNNCCRNCLSAFHSTPNCHSPINCRKCNQRHHTLLHLNTHSNTSDTPRTNDSNNCSAASPSAPNAEATKSTSLLSHNSSTPIVLLGTAVVQVQDSSGSWQPVRALLDSGSESSYVTEECSLRLNLATHSADIQISGFGNTAATNIVRGTTTLHICSSHCESVRYTLSAIIVSQIVQNLPKTQLPSEMLHKFRNLQLADPDFITPAPIELLIGADLYFDLLTGHKRITSNGPIALETSLGWIVSGPTTIISKTVNTLLTVQDPLSASLSKFWELEDIPKNTVASDDDRLANNIFESQHQRLDSGRYIVPLLFKEYPPELGNSHANAMRCFNVLQRRLLNDPKLKMEYHKFMSDYLEQTHMAPLPSDLDHKCEGFYLPHHGVLRETNAKTKLRVVFNGSKKTSTNKSLNDYLLSGPALQTDLLSIIQRSRLHRIIFTADIRQMYRQILVADEHRIYQKILWSFDPTLPPQSYILNTVTYGTTCAPFLAIRTLHQLAVDEESKFPQAAKILKSDTYVDDIISGANSLAEALDLQQDLIKLLGTAGLELRKWTSNHPDLLQHIPEDHREFSFLNEDQHKEAVKILGLSWNPFSDHFTYKISLPNHDITKRTILSDIARIFDPIGWLSPIIMIAKRIMQELWISGTDWDAQVPETLVSQWNTFKSQLPELSTLRIPRHVDSSNATLSLIGFCDASEKGYAAVVYVHVDHSGSQSCTTYLIASKTKIAPLKRISLPRLELCAALLLSRLMTNLLQTLHLSFSHILAWSDSTITLSWIRAPPYKWKTFVSNRVAEIQQNLSQNHWHHIRSQDNPADCASRGMSVQELLSHSLWWEGPSWLKESHNSWPLSQQYDESSLAPQASAESKISLVVNNESDNTLLQRYSDLHRLLRITALCIRWFRRLKFQEHPTQSLLSTSEHNNALLRWVKLAQNEVFADDIDKLNKGQLCSKLLRNLSPFIDEEGLLRVGGRIRNSNLNLFQKHPLLLPSKHRLTDLVIDYHHQKYLHPSPRTLQAILSRQFWILGARRIIRSRTLKCIKCFRCHPIPPNPPMGNLPEHRVKQLKPFDVVGIDYGGPFYVTPYKKRGFKATKAYLCLFVCFATKALHLEIASDLTTEAFILAFRRFLARRGRCSHIYSDSGTNFVGTQSYFTELQKFTTSTHYNEYLSNRLAADGTQWHFNPASAPHFGGLWEAGIKSVKFHISRVVGSQVLTLEEFNTLLCQIESILNSRPLCPLSSDPNDMHALTPNHFIMLETAVCLPDRNYLESTTLLSRWQLLQKISQDFWKRWHAEYLNTLQQRLKWTSPTPNLKPNQLVIIKNDQLPPLQWKLGRVIKVHAGDDNIVRVAQVRTTSGVLTRPVVKLCPLPES